MLEQYQRLLWNNLGGIIVALDREARVSYANQEALDVLGYKAEELLDHDWIELTGKPECRQSAREMFIANMVGRMDDSFWKSLREVIAKDGRILQIAWRNNLLRGDDGSILGIVSCGQDVTAEKSAQVRLYLHNKMAQIIELDKPFDEAAPLFLEAIARQLGWVMGELWLRQGQNNLSCQYVWRQDNHDLPNFFAISGNRLSFGKGEGLPGIVWQNAAPTWMDDVVTHSSFIRRSEAAAAGIHAAMGFPVWAGSEIAGVVLFFSEQVLQENEDMVNLCATLGIQIGNYYQRKKTEEALRKNEKTLAFGAAIVHLGIWEWDIKSDEARWSNEQMRIFGYEPGAVKPSLELFLQALVEEDRPRVQAAIQKAMEDPAFQYDVECRILAANRQLKHIRCQGEVFRDSDGVPLTMSGTVLDISQRRQSEEQLRIWGELFNNSGEAMVVTDAAPKILGINQEFTRLTGYDASEVIGKNPSILQSHHHDRVFFQKFWASLITTGYWQGEIWDKRKDGSIYPKWSNISRIKNSQGVTTHYVATFTDITERKAADEKIRYLYHYDPLTGLPNRAFLYEQVDAAIAQALRESRQVAVLSLDLDQFKIVNDSFGHNVGDMLVQQIARRLRACVRESDTVCRTGGDEFVIVLQNVKKAAETVSIAQKISEQIRQPMKVADTEFILTTSIGVSIFPNDGTERELLLRNADIAMNFAKQSGRNRCHFFTEALSDAASHKMQVVNDLHKALDRNEFILYYQPQMDLLSGRMIGVEALIRWNHPETGMVPPGEFIPIAEESGLIVPIGDWVLSEACRQCREWENADMAPLTLAVNISSIQFQQLDFVPKLADTLTTCRSRSTFEIEITEGVVMDNSEAAVRLLAELKALGCHLSIDDFGTGYSSLAYLTRFPVDRLKIDQSFVRTMLTSEANMAIVESIISLAKNLKMRVIAEGVETQEQYQALLERRCDEMQGYYYARPMAAEAFLQWRRERGC